MKGKSTVFILIAVILLALGATFFFIMKFFDENPTQPKPTTYTTGVIVEIKDNSSMLVISDISVDEAKSSTVEELLQQGNEATWFTFSLGQASELELYDQVKVGYTTIKESYPAQGAAQTVEKIEE